jgi:hypothetical protein
MKASLLLLAASLIALLSGCGAGGPETEYGLSRGTSLNGTSAFAAMLRNRGHTVRAAIRLTDDLGSWAQGIVRFAPYPGPPEADEARWFRRWLAEDPNRWLIYVVRDFDTQAEYWKEVKDGLDERAEPSRRAEAEEKRAAAALWVTRLPAKPQKTGDPKEWFTVQTASPTPSVCTKLGGLWAEDVGAQAAGLSLHESIHSDPRSVMLSGDDRPLVLDNSVIGRGNCLIVANGSFLLNEALVNPLRRALAVRVALWPDRDMQEVAFVEGPFVMAGEEGTTTIWALMKRLPSFRWVAIQMALAGIFAALARAPRLGRPRPDPLSGADRPAAHAEALGALLAAGRSTKESLELLERYRQWRRVSTRSYVETAAPISRPAELPGSPAPYSDGIVFES